MKFPTRMKSISYLTSHAAEIVKEISESREPMLITQNGEAKLVVMDVKSYEEQAETLALLQILALGKREIEQSRFRDVEMSLLNWTRLAADEALRCFSCWRSLFPQMAQCYFAFRC